MSTNLTRRLTKLEATHKQILRCAWCRFVLRNITDEQKHEYEATPAGVLSTKCWYCGTPYILRLSSTDKHYREAADLVHNSHPVKRLTDERIHAAELWLPLSKSKKEKYLEDRREKPERETSSRPSSRSAYKPTIKSNAQERKAQSERDDLLARARVFVQAKQEEFKRRAGRTDIFPIDKILDALEAGRCHAYDEAAMEEAKALGLEGNRQPSYNYRQRIASVRNALLELRKREACEVVIWGAALPVTLEEIAFFEALPPEIAIEALEEQKEAQEKAAQEAAERQRQHEEYLARTRSQQSAIVQPVAPQSAKPDHDDFLRDVLGETAYNAMREAQGLASNSRSTDRQGRRTVEIPYISPE
jgi:hypothetical protein